MDSSINLSVNSPTPSPKNTEVSKCLDFRNILDNDIDVRRESASEKWWRGRLYSVNEFIDDRADGIDSHISQDWAPKEEHLDSKTERAEEISKNFGRFWPIFEEKMKL